MQIHYLRTVGGESEVSKFDTLEQALFQGYEDAIKINNLGIQTFSRDDNKKVVCGYNTIVAITRQYMTRQNQETTIEEIIHIYVADHWPDLVITSR